MALAEIANTCRWAKDFVSEIPSTDPKVDQARRAQGLEDGEGDDEFSFTLTRDEYLEILFDGLELPDLVKSHR